MISRIYEHKESREIGNNQTNLQYVAEGFADEQVAWDAVGSQVSVTLSNGHEYEGHRLTRRFRRGAYLFRVIYKAPEFKREPLEEGEWAFNFDTTGVSANLTQSIGTRAYDANGRATGKDSMFGNGIRVTGSPPDMRPEGVQAVVPGLRFQIRASLPNSLITITYAKLMAALTGRTNNAPFPPPTMPFVDAQFAIDTVLFLGCVGSWVDSGNIELTFHFDSGETVSSLNTGDIIAIFKLPHEFVWYRYEAEDDATNKRTVVKPAAAFVEQIYQSDNLGRIFTG